MYQNILFSVEFTHAELLASQKTKELAGVFKAKLHLVHIVELPPIDIFPDVINKETLYVEQTRKQLSEVGKNLDVDAFNQYIEIGDPRTIIPEVINQHNINLLIIGHHERK
jgi:nucleotide-binding universal stress UspA family protein